jgi:hypothetical protein
MKIISSYKDYYDYLQGIYGVDDKLILNRQEETPRTFDINDYSVMGEFTRKIKGIPQYEYYSDFQVVRFSIADYLVEGMTYQGRILFGEELEFLSVETTKLAYYEKYPERDKRNSNLIESPKYYYIDNTFKPYVSKYSTNYSRVGVLKVPVKYKPEFSPNIKENAPIILYGQGNIEANRKVYKSPILSSYRINKVFDPHSIWVLLSGWLGERLNVPIPDNMSNKEKIQAAGFDLKTSFRKM